MPAKKQTTKRNNNIAELIISNRNYGA